MKKYVGIWDWLVGERITLDLPSPNGGVKKVQVTKKWFDQMQRERKIRAINSKDPAGAAIGETERSAAYKNRSTTKQELLAAVAQALKDVEAAIGHHMAVAPVGLAQMVQQEAKRIAVDGAARWKYHAPRRLRKS